MKKLLLSAAAAAALFAAPVAMAQQDQGNGQGHHDQNGGNPDQDNDHGDKAGPQGDNMGGPKPDAQQTDRDHPHAATGDKARDKATGNDHGNGNNDHGANNNDRDHDGMNGKDHDNDRTVVHNRTVVHKTVNRTEVLKFRGNITASHRFHFGVYVRPAGWYQHRWTYGERLPAAFFVRTYWITDFAMFGLMEPWDGYVWVRDGNDALLIDEDTGEIVRVEYDVFY